MNACHDSRVMYSSVLVRSASSFLPVPQEITKNDNGDDDDEKKTVAAAVVKAYGSKTNSLSVRMTVGSRTYR